jgi:hypothetical protein
VVVRCKSGPCLVLSEPHRSAPVVISVRVRVVALPAVVAK